MDDILKRLEERDIAAWDDAYSCRARGAEAAALIRELKSEINMLELFNKFSKRRIRELEAENAALRAAHDDPAQSRAGKGVEKGGRLHRAHHAGRGPRRNPRPHRKGDRPMSDDCDNWKTSVILDLCDHLAGCMEQMDTTEAMKDNLRSIKDHVRELEAENAALREARGVRVKPLVWRFHRDPKDTSEARTQIGSWTVWEINGAAYCHGPNDTCGKPCEGGINGAKAAAQADYERRILAALEPAPVTVGADAREGIVDEIEEIICETHEMDVRDRDYAENVVCWLEKHHPAALRALADAGEAG